MGGEAMDDDEPTQNIEFINGLSDSQMPDEVDDLKHVIF